MNRAREGQSTRLVIDVRPEVVAGWCVERRLGADQEGRRLDRASGRLLLRIISRDTKGSCGADRHQVAFLVEGDSVGCDQSLEPRFAPDHFIEGVDGSLGSWSAGAADLRGPELYQRVRRVCVAGPQVARLIEDERPRTLDGAHAVVTENHVGDKDMEAAANRGKVAGVELEDSSVRIIRDVQIAAVEHDSQWTVEHRVGLDGGGEGDIATGRELGRRYHEHLVGAVVAHPHIARPVKYGLLRKHKISRGRDLNVWRRHRIFL